MTNSQQVSDSPVVSGSFNAQGMPTRKKKILLGALAIAVIIVGILAAVVLMRGNDEGEPAAISNKLVSVNVIMGGFSPANVKVTKNQQVTFTNKDSALHRLTADQELLPGFDSTEDLAQGDSYTYTFETAGTYRFYDPADPQHYTGTVVVE